jgi:hypothetical protein
MGPLSESSPRLPGMGGGGRTPLKEDLLESVPAGVFPTACSEDTPLLTSGGLFVLWDRGSAGRRGNAGGGPLFLAATAWP